MANESNCNEHWCEHYKSALCNACQQKENNEDKPYLRVLLKNRAVSIIEADNNRNKARGQER
ncbi:MAG: hypothetical protein LBC96_05745 [Lachnospiraceae bacterium]|jgi:hypothetical protein|nr:hypothetical protein [Lachnospiraceae bacterium]